MSTASAPISVVSNQSSWLDALVANIQDAIVVLDGSGAVVFESPSAREILGVTPTKVIRAFGLDRVHPEEREQLVDSFERAIGVPGSIARATYRFQRADGSWQHLEAVAKNLLDDPRIHGVLVTFRDVTDRIRVLDAAERAGRAQDEFLARMSHELRTPLHAILGWAQILSSKEDETLREAVEQISEAGHHLLRLVDEGLDLAAVREGRISLDPRRLSVRSAADDAIELIRPISDRRHIRIEIAGDSRNEVEVRADPRRLRQVLLNLLSNGIKYNDYGGEVLVGWSRDESGMVRISVRDTGPGMPEDKLDRVFDRFERLGLDSLDVEGSGLGLSISRRLTELMGGTIGVDSSPGKGAEFWVKLPKAEAEEPATL